MLALDDGSPSFNEATKSANLEIRPHLRADTEHVWYVSCSRTEERPSASPSGLAYRSESGELNGFSSDDHWRSHADSPKPSSSKLHFRSPIRRTREYLLGQVLACGSFGPEFQWQPIGFQN